MSSNTTEIEAEVERLMENLKHLGWTKEECEIIAPITLEINQLKRETNTVILGHSYQTPDILYGVSDFIGDSYGLSKKAAETTADRILFAGVVFMAETAKILNPTKTVIVPSSEAGCSLADNITAEDVRNLKAKYPGRPVICYVNTTAEVKAECDVCVTSANVKKIVQSFEEEEIIFVPDKHMASNLEEMFPDKKFIKWDAVCVVHDEFRAEDVLHLKDEYPDLRVLAHTECTSDVVKLADIAGGTTDMVNYVKESESNTFLLITECGLTERLKVEFPDKNFVGTCNMCPYMKKNTLYNILEVLKNPQPDQVIEVDEDTRIRAKRSLDRMFELSA